MSGRRVDPTENGSWLNIAEIQLSVLARQALDQRINFMGDLRRILRAWHAQRSPRTVDWRSTTKDARIKLRRLYPIIERAAAGAGGLAMMSDATRRERRRAILTPELN